MTSESLKEAHGAALWKIHRVRTMNGNVYVVAVGDVKDTLNKIRAEIEQEYKVESENPYGQGLRRALEIFNQPGAHMA